MTTKVLRFGRAGVLASLLAAAAARAQIGTPVQIGLAESSGAESSLTITTTVGVPAGASILVASHRRDNQAMGPGTPSCSDSASHTYATDVSVTTIDNGAICSTHAIAAQLTVGSTITVTWTGAADDTFYDTAVAFYVTGLTSAPLDKTAGAVGISDAPTSGATSTTTQPYELLFGAIWGGAFSTTDIGFVPGTNGTANTCAATGTSTCSIAGSAGSIPRLGNGRVRRTGDVRAPGRVDGPDRHIRRGADPDADDHTDVQRRHRPRHRPRHPP